MKKSLWVLLHFAGLNFIAYLTIAFIAWKLPNLRVWQWTVNERAVFLFVEICTVIIAIFLFDTVTRGFIRKTYETCEVCIRCPLRNTIEITNRA